MTILSNFSGQSHVYITGINIPMPSKVYIAKPIIDHILSEFTAFTLLPMPVSEIYIIA